MKVETYKCDVCGKQKGQVNHWWIVGEVKDLDGPALGIARWSEENAVQQDVLHLCGAECVQKKVNEFLSKPVPTEEAK